MVEEYSPDIGQTNVGGYGTNKDPYCHKVEKVVFENQCEPYTEKTCWTQNKEHCEGKMFKNCTGVIETNVERVCFNVNELVCSLVEAIFYETLEETYQVQRCFTGKDRVCDTTYKVDTTTKDDYQCCNVETPNCFMEEKVINDVTCTNTVEFNCMREKTTKNDGYGQKEVVCTRTLAPRRLRSTATPRTARSSQGRSVTSARRSPSSPCVTCSHAWSVSTSLRRSAGKSLRSTAIRWRRWCWRKCAN